MSSTSYSNYLLSSEFSESSSVDTASNRKSSELSGDFGDGLCGEPLFTQHLLIDFTPNTDIDNDIVQKKVCEFWECIKNAPHIHHLMVKPEKKSTLSPKDCIELLKAAQGKTDVEKTAIAMLELVKEEGLIERAFEANLPPAVCTVDTGEYKENVLEIMQNDNKLKI